MKHGAELLLFKAVNTGERPALAEPSRVADIGRVPTARGFWDRFWMAMSVVPDFPYAEAWWLPPHRD